MARREELDRSDDPFFVTSRNEGATKTQLVRGAPVKIHRAAGTGSFSQSEGVDTRVEWLDPNSVEDWVPDASELVGAEASGLSGFGRHAQVFGDEYTEQARFPIESRLDEKRIIEAADPNAAMPDPRRRIKTDPVTRIPENVAEVDRMSESDNFFGADKVVPETDAVLERMKNVDRTRERVDYGASKAMPIKVIRRT